MSILTNYECDICGSRISSATYPSDWVACGLNVKRCDYCADCAPAYRERQQRYSSTGCLYCERDTLTNQLNTGDWDKLTRQWRISHNVTGERGD